MHTLLGKELHSSGRFLRKIKLRSEGWDFLSFPEQFIEELRTQRVVRGDVFSFIEQLGEKQPNLPYYFEPESIAVLKVDSYEKWFTHQINSKTRNMIRKATTKGVRIDEVSCSDNLIRGIQEIQDETPVRQGMSFWHYRESFETTKLNHVTFLSRSHFIGAYLNDELIGYIKLVDNGQWMGIMQILSKLAHRDKAPTNAMLAKAVELCTRKGLKMISYGVWSTRTLGDFKIHHGFERQEIRRYYCPLTLHGRIALLLRMHRSPKEYLPESVRDTLAALRAKINARWRTPEAK